MIPLTHFCIAKVFLLLTESLQKEELYNVYMVMYMAKRCKGLIRNHSPGKKTVEHDKEWEIRKAVPEAFCFLQTVN